MTDSQHKPTLVPNTHSFELAIVLEFRECLKRILGCATEHDTFVDHLQRRKRHHDVFRADAQEAANRQDSIRCLPPGATIRSSIVPTVSLASLTTLLPISLEADSR